MKLSIMLIFLLKQLQWHSKACRHQKIRLILVSSLIFCHFYLKKEIFYGNDAIFIFNIGLIDRRFTKRYAHKMKPLKLKAPLEKAIEKNIVHQDIIQACLGGDRTAQEQLYRLYAKNMLNSAYRIVHNEEDARDILQESFIKAFRNLDKFRFDSSFGSWLKTIVINTSLNHIKKKKINLINDGEKVLSYYASEEENNQLEEQELELALAKKALMQLSPGYRSIVTLYLIEGYQHKEIAEILDISLSTSLSQYKRGKEKLKSIIQQLKSNG